MKKGLYNILFGLLGQVITICLGIVVPRLVLVSFGSEVNGLLNSITQIFAYFTLIEAGIGTTTLQALYRPTAENDRESINHILSATNKYYKKVALIYLGAVLTFATIYPLTVKSSLSFVQVFLIILLNGMGSVINFWVQGKYVIFLNAIGKTYVNTNLGTVTSVLTSISKIVLLMNGCDVLRLQIVYFVISIIKMSFIYFYIQRKYNWIDLTVTPDYDSLEQKNSVLVHQISTLIFNNIDIILITYFLGLKQVSVYSMYLMLFTYLNNITLQIYTGFNYRLGQIYNSSVEKYKKFHDIFEVYYLVIVFAVYTVALIFVLPFLSLYTSGVTDVNYIDWKLALLFYLMNLLSSGRMSSIMVINFAGHFRNTIKQTVLESSINLIASILFINIFGIYGVLMGTIAALLYRMLDMVFYSNRLLLHRSPLVTFRRWGRNILFSVVIIALISRLPLATGTYISLFITAGITSICVLGFYLLLNALIEKTSTIALISFIKSYLKKVNYNKL